MSWPFETMTEQEVFDKVARHLLTQNAISRFGGGQCAYRGENGLMCAAGCLISDDQYNARMEGKDWLTLNLSLAHCKLIAELQGVHDEVQVTFWKNKLKNLAAKYNLEFKFDDFVPGEQT